jgi:WD40 repeat protein
LCPLKGHSASVNCVDFSPDGLTIASGSGSQFENDNSVRVWDAKTGKQLWQLKGHSKGNEECTCKYVAGIFGDKCEPNPDCPVTGHQSAVSSVHFSPDGKRLVSGSWDKTVMVWDPSTGEQLCQLNVDAGEYGVRSVSFSPKGDMVAAGCYNGKVYFVDPTAGEIKSSLNVGYAFSRFSTRIFLPARPLFSRFSTKISV